MHIFEMELVSNVSFEQVIREFTTNLTKELPKQPQLIVKSWTIRAAFRTALGLDIHLFREIQDRL